MLKLNKLTDYAVVVLSYLWQHAPMQKTASDLAFETGLPEPTLVKLLKQLASKDLVQSRRGAGGGYFVDKNIGDNLSIWRIIEVVEGPVALTACVVVEDEVKDCCIAGTCPLQNRWKKVNNALFNLLDNIMLSDMQECDLEKKMLQYG